MKAIYRKINAWLLIACLLLVYYPAITFATEEISDTSNECDLLEHLDNDTSDDAAYSSNITEYHSFVVSYFDNLTVNFGKNYHGTCGYVAIAMLLSYYDTFWDDSIIPEAYDVVSDGSDSDMISRRNSPGIYHDVIQNADVMTATEYYDALAEMVSYSLHARLIQIGSELGYYNASSNTNFGSTNFTRRLNVLNNYLQNVAGFNEDDYTISSYNGESDYSLSDSVREFAIAKVQAGYPVLLSISGTPGGHVVVAYDYNAQTDELYCHFGWGASTTHITAESQSFTVYKTALTIEFAGEHSHSNNYAVTTDETGTQTYCYDDAAITVVTHDYTDSYGEYTSEYHKAYCSCGEYILESHNVDDCSCAACGCAFHDYTGWQYYNSLHHIEVCECGVTGTVTAVHAVRASSTVNMRGVCLGCGALLDLSGDMSVVDSVERYVTANGSYILPSGIVVLADEDVEAYLNGTLVFYNASEVPEVS